MGKDIAYHIRRVWEKETAILSLNAFVISSGAKWSRETPLRTLEVIQRDVSTSPDMTEN
jgi:hypothetical protein